MFKKGMLKSINKFLFGEQEVEEEYTINNIILDIERMKQKLSTITIYAPEKETELSLEIEKFKNRLKDDIYGDEEIESEFSIFKDKFNEELKKCEEKYLFNQINKIREVLDKIFYGEETEEKYVENEYKAQLEVLDKKKTEFDRAKQQLYITEIIKAKYRINCYNAMDEWRGNKDSIINASKPEKIIYATILAQDINKYLNTSLIEIENRYKAENEECKILPLIKNSLNAFLREIEKMSADDVDLSEIFNNKGQYKYLLDTYLEIAQRIKTTRANLEIDIKHIKKVRKEKEEQKKKQEEKERIKKEEEKKYKNLTEEEMRKKLEEIDDEIFDTTQTYIRIMQYEQVVAEARDLLSKKDKLELDDMEIQRVSKDTINVVLQRGNNTGLNYSILLETDDSKKNNIIIFPKGKETSFLHYIQNSPYSNRSYLCEIPGKFTKAFAEYISQRENKIIGILNQEKLFYEVSIDPKKVKLELLKILEELQEKETTPEMISKVKIGLRMPYTRPMIPILEKLKEAGIEYYIPPISEKIYRKKCDKEIYIDRKDLEKYKKLVQPQVYTKELGNIEIVSENIDINKRILEGVEIDFIKDLLEEKKLQKELMKITEDELRKKIKEISDKNFDITTNYKKILDFEKKVAKAKGILSEKNSMENEDLRSIRLSKEKVAALMIKAKNRGLNYTVLLDVDENVKANCMVIISKNDLRKISTEITLSEDNIDGNYTKIEGKYGKSFKYALQTIQNDSGKWRDISNEKGDQLYITNHSESWKKEKSYYDAFETTLDTFNDKEFNQNIKTYIKINYLRNMIPILEELKKEGIEYYIPPIDENFNKTNSTIKIYIDRKDLEKYKEKVHNVISTADKGIIEIGLENINFKDLLLEGTDSPYIDKDRKGNTKKDVQ